MPCSAEGLSKAVVGATRDPERVFCRIATTLNQVEVKRFETRLLISTMTYAATNAVFR